MRDLISRQAVMKTLEEVFDEYKMSWKPNEKYGGFARAVPEAIKNIPAIDKIDWISVNERFPENNDYILLSFENYPLPCIGTYEEDKEGGAFYLDNSNTPCVKHGIFVNAWMPLPKQYREEEDEEHE